MKELNCIGAQRKLISDLMFPRPFIQSDMDEQEKMSL